MTHRTSVRVAQAAFVSIIGGIGSASLAFPPPTQANPPAEYTAAINVDYNNVQTFSQILSFNPNDPFSDYPKIYWFKYTSNGQSVVKFDTLGSDFGSAGGGAVLGIHNDSQVAVYSAAGQLMGLGKSAQDFNGDPQAIWPYYSKQHDPTNWYTPQGLTELYFYPDAPRNPHWDVSPTDPNPFSGWTAPGNDNAQKYYPPYYPTSLNEYHVWSTALSTIILDNNDQPVIDPNTGQPRPQPGWRYYDRARAGPGSPWSRYEILPAGDYYIAVSSGLPVFAGDVPSEEVLQAPIHYDSSTDQNNVPILTEPMGAFQYWLDPSAHDQYGTIVFNVTQETIPISSEWAVSTGGNWADAATGNWSNSQVPDGRDHIATFATFNGTITAPQTVTLPAPITAGVINFDNAASYTIAGTNALTLSSLIYPSAQINVLSGSHTISTPVVLNNNLAVTSAAGSGVALTGSLSAADKIIDKFGAGTVQFENARAWRLNVAEGTVRISAKASANSPSGTSVISSLAIADGASLDLTNNSFVLDYDGAVGTLLTDTRLKLQSGQISSSSADSTHRLGYLDNATRGLATFSGQSVDPTSILIKFTYGGDANLDGQVDVTDLGALATNWQTSNVWTGGDFNYDGFVDVTDLGILATDWQLGVGSPLGPGSLQAALASVGLASVPEPAASTLFCLALAGLARRKRRT